MSQTIGKAPDSIETVYDPDPVLKDWILVSAPDSSKLNAFKNRIVVNSPTPLNQRSTETIKVISQDKTKINDSVSDDEFPRQDIQDESIFNIHDQLGSTNKSNSFEESYTFSDSTQTQSSNKNTFTSTQTRQTTNTENSAPKATNRSVEPTAAKRVIPVVTTQTESSRRKLPVQVAPPSKSFFSGYSVTPNKRTLPVQTTTPNKRLSPAENAPPVKRVLPTQFYLSKSGPIKPPVNYTLESIKLYEALSDEQKKIHDIVMNEKSNIFFTGSAGTGKSVLLRALISRFRTLYTQDEVAITAPTAVAALNIEGVTIHKFAHVNLGNLTQNEYVEKIFKNRNYVNDLNKVRVLIVDEISMLDGNLLDKIEYICRTVRRNVEKPFGGIRVVFCGDFFQLPPVDKSNQYVMAFEAKCWNRVIDKSFVLKTTFRQTDSEFISILNEIRQGRVSDESEKKMQLLSRQPELESGIEQTELYSLRWQVEKANNEKLEKLPGSLHVFQASDFATPSYENELKNFMAPKVLTLKTGSQVMLIKNISSTLVNGSVGKVIGFQNIEISEGFTKEIPIVEFRNGETKALDVEDWTREVKGARVVASRSQIPLMLAWAMSIHKSQGQTIPYAKVNLNNSFERGQVYVALSRATRMDTLQVLNFTRSAIIPNPVVAEFYRKLEAFA